MRSSWLTVVLAVGLVVAGVGVVHQHREIAALRDSLRVASAKPAAVVNPPAAKPRPVSASPATLPAPVVATPAGPATAAATNATAAARKPPGFFGNLGSMTKDPAMRNMIRAQHRMTLDMTYGSLFRDLALSPEETDAFKDLLVDRQLALMDGSIALMSGDVPAADRAQKTKDLEQIKTSFDKQIADYLGADDYAVFKEYEQTQPERMQVNLFKQSLGGSQPLTDAQEQDLVQAMYEARQQFAPSTFAKTTTPDPGQFTEEKLAEQMKQMEQMQAQYADRAATILSPAQLEQFKKSMEQQRAMMTGAMKMAAQMFGQQNPAAPPTQATGPTPGR